MSCLTSTPPKGNILPLPQVPVHRYRHNRRKPVPAHAVTRAQPDTPTLGLGLMNDIAVNIPVDIARPAVRPDAVKRGAHSAHPCRVGRIISVHLLFLCMAATVHLDSVARQPRDVRLGERHHQCVYLRPCHHDGWGLYGVGLMHRLSAGTGKPPQSETGDAYQYVRQCFHYNCIQFNVFLIKYPAHANRLRRERYRALPSPAYASRSNEIARYALLEFRYCTSRTSHSAKYHR